VIDVPMMVTTADAGWLPRLPPALDAAVVLFAACSRGDDFGVAPRSAHFAASSLEGLMMGEHAANHEAAITSFGNAELLGQVFYEMLS